MALPEKVIPDGMSEGSDLKDEYFSIDLCPWANNILLYRRHHDETQHPWSLMVYRKLGGFMPENGWWDDKICRIYAGNWQLCGERLSRLVGDFSAGNLEENDTKLFFGVR